MAEEAVNSLVSVRNLTEGGARTPLRKFRGKFAGFDIEQSYGKDRVNLKFSGVAPIESTEPYNFPTAVIGIKLSNRKNSGWGVFSDSLTPFLSEDEDIGSVEGLDFLMEMEKDHVFRKARPEAEEMKGDVWRVIEVEGREAQTAVKTAEVAGDSPAEAEAKKLLDGSSLADFNKAAYSSPIIKKDVAFQKAITDKSFVKSMIALKLFDVDKNGVYHKVGIGGLV